MLNSPVAGALLATILFAPALTAQRPLQRADDPDVVRFQTEGAGIRTGGRAYRARFDVGGVEFTPALGAKAEHAMPLRFELESIRRGGALVLEAGPATPLATGQTVDYHRGNGVTERYDVRGDGVEQSFVFDQLAGRGDLVVRGRVATALQADATGAADRIDFELDGIGGVRFDQIVGIDAGGRRAAGTMRWDGEHLDLVLPAAFVDTAALPLVLDPLLGTVNSIGNNSLDNREAEVAFSEADLEYLVAYSTTFAADDIEIRAARRDENNSSAGAIFAVTDGVGIVNRRPSVARVDAAGCFVIAWESSPSPLGPFDLVARTVDVAGSLGTAATVVSNSNVSYPDVAGRPGGSLVNTFVVYAVPGSGLRSVRLQISAGTISATAPTSLVNDAAAAYPRVSNGSANSYALAWQSEGNGLQTVRCARLDSAGMLNSTVLTISNSNEHRSRPDVDGDGTLFKLAYGSDVGGIRVRDLTFPGGTPTLGTNEWLAQGAGLSRPRIGWIGPKFVAVWSEEIGFLDYRVEGREFMAQSGFVPCGDVFRLGAGPANGAEYRPAIGTQRGGSTITSRESALLVWDSIAQQSPFDSRLRGQIVRAFTGASAEFQSGGCGDVVNINASGFVAIGNADLEFELTSFSVTPSFCFFLYGLGATTTCPTGGSCTVISPIATAVGVPVASFLWSTPLPLPPNGDLVGLPLEVQGLALGTPSSPCTAFPNLSATPRFRYVLDY
ncbi:MAG: hypothetical protein KDE27_14315 [Planctomycetes bacterium]|nr:hypothetical protein [Planctomycetota bacterium]